MRLRKCFWKVVVENENKKIKRKIYKSPLVKYAGSECNKCKEYNYNCIYYSFYKLGIRTNSNNDKNEFNTHI